MNLRTQFACLIPILAAVLCSRTSAENWPMLGRDITRNPVSPEKNPPIDWDIETALNIKWKFPLGSVTHGTPVVADGQVYIGTNNGAGYIERFPTRVDLGVLLCLRESDGEFLWQYSSPKLPAGRVHDWPLQGIGASPLVEGDRLWFVSNRWEVVCLDTKGFRDGENDGPVVDEPVQDKREADVVWRFDMIKELGVFPHNQGMGPTRRCSPAASYQDRIYVVTGNGVDSSHVKIPKPEAPSLVCLDKNTGEVKWKDNSPGANILHGQFASPLVAEIAGRAQVIVPFGDGWIRSFDPMNGKLLWKFDINLKETKWILGGSGNRNHILASPVLYNNRIYIASGQEAEHGEGPGRLVCIDPTKSGDISSELAVDRAGSILPQRRLQAVDTSKGERAIPNPNSGLIWEFISEGDKYEEEMHRTLASVAIQDGRLVLGDFSGIVSCFDADTGKQLWYYDCFSPVWSNPLIVDRHVYICDEDGDVAIIQLTPGADAPQNAVERKPLAEIYIGNSVKGSPIYANGTLYIATNSMLYAIPGRVSTDSEGTSTKKPQSSYDRKIDPRRIPNSGFTPTPPEVVDRMLELADLKRNGLVYDLGSGDGRVVIAAAQKYGCRGVGYEIEGQLVKESRQTAKDAGVSQQVEFIHADLFSADLSKADAVFVYLWPIQLDKLIPRFQKLKPGTPIVSHHFKIPGIDPDRTVHVKSKSGDDEHEIYVWTAPLRKR